MKQLSRKMYNMKLLFFAVSLTTSAIAFAGIQPEITSFLSQFPDKMSCDGVQASYMVRKPLAQKVTIEIKNKLSDNPMIEVTAPSASLPADQRFRIGDGYGARMEKLGTYSYEFLSGQDIKALLYVRRAAGDDTPFDMVMYMRLRDAGQVISFTSSRVCRRPTECIEFSGCIAL